MSLFESLWFVLESRFAKADSKTTAATTRFVLASISDTESRISLYNCCRCYLIFVVSTTPFKGSFAQPPFAAITSAFQRRSKRACSSGSCSTDVERLSCSHESLPLFVASWEFAKMDIQSVNVGFVIQIKVALLFIAQSEEIKEETFRTLLTVLFHSLCLLLL